MQDTDSLRTLHIRAVSQSDEPPLVLPTPGSEKVRSVSSLPPDADALQKLPEETGSPYGFHPHPGQTVPECLLRLYMPCQLPRTGAPELSPASCFYNK